MDQKDPPLLLLGLKILHKIVDAQIKSKSTILSEMYYGEIDKYNSLKRLGYKSLGNYAAITTNLMDKYYMIITYLNSNCFYHYCNIPWEKLW